MRAGSSQLDAKDTLVLKGMAILAIAAHNYFHLLLPVKENEFDFDAARFPAFLQAVQDPRLTFEACASYVGHYGVQLFMFLSAYGLAIRYWDSALNWKQFVWTRAKKIYPMFFLAILAWALFVGILDPNLSPPGAIRAHAETLLLTILGVQNLVPGYDLPPVGPWWFVPFIVQFYLLWPGVKRFAARFGALGLMVLGCASLGLTWMVNDALVRRWSINLLETPLGHMPELLLGVAAARYGVLPGPIAGLAALAVLVFANIYGSFWTLSFISALVLMLWFYGVARDRLRRVPLLEYLGRRSMAIFFVNGFTRWVFLELASQHKTWLPGLALGLASIGFAVAIAEVLSECERRLRLIGSARRNSGLAQPLR